MGNVITTISDGYTNNSGYLFPPPTPTQCGGEVWVEVKRICGFHATGSIAPEAQIREVEAALQPYLCG